MDRADRRRPPDPHGRVRLGRALSGGVAPDDAGPDRLRAERARLVADGSLRGRALGAALAGLLDEAFAAALAATAMDGRHALVAMGSYGRRELCPGSDVDVMLLAPGRRTGAIDDVASALWYPLWDAGFVLGHSVRSVRDAVALADEDPEAMTALLEARPIAGDRSVADDLAERVRRLAVRRRSTLVDVLATAAWVRRDDPGPVAEMLEPDLKRGAGGLRDAQALEWIGWTLDDGGAGGLDRLVERGYLDGHDRARLVRARDQLLDVRVALHRTTGTRSDVLALQEQDAVARCLGVDDADLLVHRVAAAGRVVAWVATDVWSRLQATVAGPLRRTGVPRAVDEGVVVRDGRIAFAADARIDAVTVLRAGARAAALDLPFERPSLERTGALADADVRWGPEERAALVALLEAGRRAVPVLEAFDHVGVLTRFLPEWEWVRSRPQRNAYHRFTVDRHLLEAVAECAALRAEEGFDGDVGRRVRADLLLLAALLHDIAKGRPGDHSALGAQTARVVAARMGFDEASTATLEWLVRHHLLLADTATRRDLAEETTVLRFGRTVGTAERLDLLYVLTVGDSRATGPAAWSTPKAALVRELYLRTDALLEAGIVDTSEEQRRRAELATLIGAEPAGALLEAFPPAYAAAFDAATMARHAELLAGDAAGVAWDDVDGLVHVTVVAPDRPGLLSRVAATLATLGFDVRHASAFGHAGDRALEVFAGEDTFGRLGEPDERARAAALVVEAATGEADVTEALRARRRRYRRPPGVVTTRVDVDASATATVVEVEAPDEVGLLATITSVLADLGLEITQAKVQTLGERVIDVFYVRDAEGEKITDRVALERLRATVVARLTREYALPDDPA